MPPPPKFILDENKVLGNYDKHLPLGDCFLSGLLISGLTKEKCNFFFVLTKVVMAQPQWPANDQASIQLFNMNDRWHIIFFCATHCLNLSASAAVKVSAIQ